MLAAASSQGSLATELMAKFGRTGWSGGGTCARDALSTLHRKKTLHCGRLLLPDPGSVGSQRSLAPGPGDGQYQGEGRGSQPSPEVRPGVCPSDENVPSVWLE